MIHLLPKIVLPTGLSEAQSHVGPRKARVRRMHEDTVRRRARTVAPSNKRRAPPQPEVIIFDPTLRAILHVGLELIKKVQVKELSSGLLRGSIASQTAGSRDSLSRACPVVKTILDEVSGSAEPGEVLALMGPSGSGKTSLLNILSGRSSYDTGTISINGRPLTSQSRKKLMSKIAYVKQSDVFFDHLTVKDQLVYTALLRLPSTVSREDKIVEVDKVISLLRLNKVAGSPIMLCSGGEKKRINIATELLTDPEVLLLDELHKWS
ncbi:ATP- binding [Fragilaria crotonensis]|nr:ATP- binding [Fragilaria crotonensis]